MRSKPGYTTPGTRSHPLLLAGIQGAVCGGESRTQGLRHSVDVWNGAHPYQHPVTMLIQFTPSRCLLIDTCRRYPPIPIDTCRSSPNLLIHVNNYIKEKSVSITTTTLNNTVSQPASQPDKHHSKYARTHHMVNSSQCNHLPCEIHRSHCFHQMRMFINKIIDT